MWRVKLIFLLLLTLNLQAAYTAGNRISATDALGNTTTFTYDAQGNMLSFTDALNQATQYVYNSLNQLIKETVTNDPNGTNTATTFNYDLVGNLLTKTINGINTTYDYNDNDQLTQQDSITFTYDSNGNLIAKDNTTYEYDDKNRLIKTTTPKIKGTGCAKKA